MDNPSPFQIKSKQTKWCIKTPLQVTKIYMSETKEFTVLLQKVKISSLTLIQGAKLQNISK